MAIAIIEGNTYVTKYMFAFLKLISERAKRVSSVTVHAPLKFKIYTYFCGAGLCRFSVFYMCDRFTDPITEVKVKVQEKDVNAHAQYQLL